MESLAKVEEALHRLFQVEKMEKDPAFSRFIPMVYDPLGFDWRQTFEAEFVDRFNGLMIRGDETVRRVFLAVFPTTDVLDTFIQLADEGDLLFMHHPLHMECGDPKGAWGRGFVPIAAEQIAAIKRKQLSVYTCHVPMDYGWEIGTNAAIVQSLGLRHVEGLCREGDGFLGRIGDLNKTNTRELIQRLLTLFDIPYVDFEGREQDSIRRVVVVAGCGDQVEVMRQAEALGAQAYITGEVHCHIDNEYGRRKYRQMMEYVPQTEMSLIGVSHAASEFYVMKVQMKDWFEQHFHLECTLLPQHRWWL